MTLSVWEIPGLLLSRNKHFQSMFSDTGRGLYGYLKRPLRAGTLYQLLHSSTDHMQINTAAKRFKELFF